MVGDMDAAEDCMFRLRTDDNHSRDAENAISNIGAELRRLRTKRGERLEDIAAYLGVTSIYLYSIEQGDLSVIPSKRDVHTIASRYASYLGLDDEGITGQLSAIISRLGGAKAPSGRRSHSGLDRNAVMILASAVMLGIVAGWSYLGNIATLDLVSGPMTADLFDEDATGKEDNIAGNVDGVLDERSNDSEQALATRNDQAAEAQAGEPSISQPPASNKTGAESQPAPAQAAAVISEEAPPDPNQARPANVLATLVAERGDGAEIYEPENIDARVIVRALDTSWIQVSSRDRTYLWTRTMQPREMLLVPNRGDLELWAGDASGVEILLDGVVLPALGPPGTVVRGVSLAPETLQALADSEAGGKPTF